LAGILYLKQTNWVGIKANNSDIQKAPFDIFIPIQLFSKFMNIFSVVIIQTFFFLKLGITVVYKLTD